MRRLTAAVSLTTLALVLAGCGTTTPVPVTGADGNLVSVNVVAPSTGLPGLGTLGLTGDAPARHVTVTVRDGNNKVVSFNGTAYDPSGYGAKTLELNLGNHFRQTLLLPAGTYTFENAVMDDAMNSTLLAYGPATENIGTLTSTGGVVRLSSHAVMDVSRSSLAPTMSTPQLFTDSAFNLGLNPKTAPVMGTSASVPTSDIGSVNYSLGNPTDGEFNSAGSKVGVNVTARGTDADSTLNVTATFDAWQQVAGTTTATYRSASISYAQGIATNAAYADSTMPVVSFSPVVPGNTTFALRPQAVVAPQVGVPLTLSGTATDDVQISAVRVYDNTLLVGSSSPNADGGSLVNTDAAGAWNVSWVPQRAGLHELMVIATDSNGNETRVRQSVTVAAATGGTADYDALYSYGSDSYVMQYPTVAPFSELWIKVSGGPSGLTQNMSVYSYNGNTGLSVSYGPSHAAQTPVPMYYMNSYATTVPGGDYYVHLVNASANSYSTQFTSGINY